VKPWPSLGLTDAGVEPSIDSVGGSHDNALAETINGLHKTKAIRCRGSWCTLEAVEFASLEWSTGSTTGAFPNPSRPCRIPFRTAVGR